MKELFTLESAYHGAGPVLFSWQVSGNLLATTGSNSLVHIFDRHGKHIDEISLSSSQPVLALEWDKDGESLAVLQAGNGAIPIWDVATRKVKNLETNLKDPTFLKWSKTGPQLAIGTGKGNLLIYRKDIKKKIPVLGKHAKKITCGAWINNNRLALGSTDKTLTISSADGDTLEQTELKFPPENIQFLQVQSNPIQTGGPEASSGTKFESRHGSTISINMGREMILLYQLDDPDNPIQLAFQKKYGQIVSYKWFKEGFIMIAFSDGYLVVVSTHLDEIGEEIFSGRFHNDTLIDIAYSETMQRAATCGEKIIKLVDMTNWKPIRDETIKLNKACGSICMLSWTCDGQILTVGTDSGDIFNFLAKMPTVHDACNTRVAFLSSLREISVVDTVDDGFQQISIELSIEPSFIALSPTYTACGMNIRIWFYRLGNSMEDKVPIAEREFPGNIESVCLNTHYAAVLVEGKIHLFLIEPQSYGDEDTKIFNENSGRITHMDLRDDVLIYIVDSNSRGLQTCVVKFFSLRAWVMLEGCEYRHDTALRAVYPNKSGTRLCLLDESGRGWIYNPSASHIFQIEEFGGTDGRHSVTMVLWDDVDWGAFVVVEGETLATYVYSPVSINGPVCTKIGSIGIGANGDMKITPNNTKLPHGCSPISIFNGRITCQRQNGQLDSVVLQTHTNVKIRHGMEKSRAYFELCFNQRLALMRLKDAWDVAVKLKERRFWLALSGKALEQLDIAMALRVYRALGDAGMTQSLERVVDVEDKRFLAGYVHILFSDYSKAQENFLGSTVPQAALEMRRDLLHWDHALKLAETIDPSQVPFISAEYAQQLEFKGKYGAALQNYESAILGIQALNTSPGYRGKESTISGSSFDADRNKLAKYESLCECGIARMMIRQGDIRRGVSRVKNNGNASLCRECASILETMRQYPEAARLFELGGCHEKAAAVYIQCKDFTSAAPLMTHIKSAKLHGQYAKAKEAAKDYEAAIKAYEAANDMDSVVRLYLDYVDNPELAFAIVRSTSSANAAQMVATFCRVKANWAGAIEFLLMAKRGEEAFELAEKHNQMDIYANAMKDNGSSEDYMKIAKHYERKANWGKAGKYWAISGKYHQALKLFLKCGEDEIEKAIEVVGKAKSQILTHTLIDYLMGEEDGVPKDPNYIFRLYMALGNFKQAAKTANIIARQEQELGNYKVAHLILFETIKDLEAQNVKVPANLRSSFLLLHSYILVKKLVKQGDHVNAAHMLMRVADNISKFPMHTVQILTSAVIECQRSGMKAKAFEYASLLMTPNNRKSVPEKFRKKIENIVRKKRGVLEDVKTDASPSPFDSKVKVPVDQLICPTTRNDIPWCIVSGYHMEIGDWSICPNTNMPALHSKYIAWLKKDPYDPITGKPVDLSAIQLLRKPKVVHITSSPPANHAQISK
jgi:WD repeat-containing protein 19